MFIKKLQFGLKERTMNQINQIFKLHPDIDLTVVGDRLTDQQ
jgi:hypothetical protein